jgi:hypothetical protein
VLSEFVTPGVLQPTSLKRISSRDSGQESEKGEDMISLLNRDYKRRLHNFADYNSRGSRGITTKNKLIQLTTSLELDKDVDNGGAKGK